MTRNAKTKFNLLLFLFSLPIRSTFFSDTEAVDAGAAAGAAAAPAAAASVSE